jgi:NADH-quinone oxidoreductase subunit E
MVMEARQNSEESEVAGGHAAFARLADASAKLFAEQAAAMAAMTALGISVAGQMTGLMLGTFRPAEDNETAPVREPAKTDGDDSKIVHLRAKPEKSDGAAEPELGAEKAAAPTPAVETELSKPEAVAEAGAPVAKAEPRKEAGKPAAKTEAKETAPKIAVRTAAPKTTIAKPGAKAEIVEPAPRIAAAKTVSKARPAKSVPEKIDAVKQAANALSVSTGDDLKRISGIGPRLEKVLNGRGISTYAEIAGLSKAALKKIDDELGLEGRVIRDDWQGQAKALAAGAPDAAG